MFWLDHRPRPASEAVIMTVMLRPLDIASAPAWDAFVAVMPNGTFFHRAPWARVIEAAFGHRTHYVYAERDGSIVGVLPLAQVKTLLFGHTLISVPFCVYGGPLAADAETNDVLESYATSLLASTGASALEFRERDGVESDWAARSDLYVTFRKAIDADHERNMKAIPRKQRAMVRKGIQNGLTSMVNHEVGPLHRIYSESVRNLGTPVFSRRYFTILLEEFRDCVDVVTIMDGDNPIASVMNFYDRDEVLPYYGGGNFVARQRGGNDFMYWEVMRRAADRGCRLFDFGRSKLGTGAFAFKHNWGFVPAPLVYRYKLAPGASIPEHNPMNPKYRMFIAGWKRLPLPVANLLGPPIVRGLG
jgi:FemAB-related protein (PEP-CTERM system-associated)